MKILLAAGLLIAASTLPPGFARAATKTQSKPRASVRQQSQMLLFPPINLDAGMVHGYGTHPERMDHMNVLYGDDPEHMDHIDIIKPAPGATRKSQKPTTKPKAATKPPAKSKH